MEFEQSVLEPVLRPVSTEMKYAIPPHLFSDI